MIERLSALVLPITGDLSLDLVEIQIVGNARNPIVRAFIDRRGGVTIDDCTAVSQRLSLELDVADLFEASYTLEVSSPGLDRPLVSLADFARREGYEVKVFLKDEKKPVKGKIKSADGTLTLETTAGENEIAFDRVEKGLLVY